MSSNIYTKHESEKFKYIIDRLKRQDLHKTDEMLHNILTDKLWDMSENVMHYGTDEEKSLMKDWAKDCEMRWKNGRWAEINDEDEEEKEEITELKKKIAEYEAVEQNIMKTIRNGGEYDDILKAHYREGKVVDGEWVDDKEENDDDSDNIAFNCEGCDTPIIRDSEEHDNSKCDDEGEKWYCEDCEVPDEEDEDDDDEKPRYSVWIEVFDDESKESFDCVHEKDFEYTEKGQEEAMKYYEEMKELKMENKKCVMLMDYEDGVDGCVVMEEWEEDEEDEKPKPKQIRKEGEDYIGRFCGDMYGCDDGCCKRCYRCNPLHYWLTARDPPRPDMVKDLLKEKEDE